jgi:hypothetical protein
MPQICKLIGAIFSAITGIVSSLPTAFAQDATILDGYQFFVTPYLWLASVHATTKTPLPNRPEVNSNVSTVDLLSHLDGAPFMGSVEIRYGRFGLFGDAIHLPVSTNITTHDVFFQGGSAALKANTGTGLVFYREFEDPVQFVDAGLGFRAWSFSMNLKLNPGLLSGTAVTRSDGWTDPLLGGRYHRELGNGFALTAYGDVVGLVSAHMSTGSSSARSTTLSTHGSTFTSVIAASILIIRRATEIWALMSI